MGQKWGSHNSGWWFLWRWRFWRGTGQPYTTGWEVCFPIFAWFQFRVLSFHYVTDDAMATNHRWDVNVNTDCCSEKVEIIFSALHSTISEIGDKALTWQGRSVISDIIDIVRWNLPSFFQLLLFVLDIILSTAFLIVLLISPKALTDTIIYLQVVTLK